MERLTRLDGLRGILALYILAGHALRFTALPHWLGAPFHHGEAAVDLFFALSGLVVFNSLERFNYQFWPFLRGRARRLLPVYFSALGVAVLIIALGSPLASMPWLTDTEALLVLPQPLIWHVLAHVTLIHGLIPEGLLSGAWITILGPAWSLSTEWQFYVFLALLLPRMKGSRRVAHFAYLMLGLGACYRPLSFMLPAYWQFSRAFLPDAAPYFALGLAAAVWMRNRNPIPYLVCLSTVFALGLLSEVPARAFIAIAWTAVLLAQRNPRMPLLPKLLDSRAAQYLGAISYPLYLINEPMQRVCALLIAPYAHHNADLFAVLWLPAALSTPILAAMALHHWIEAPAIRRRMPKLPVRLALFKSRQVAEPQRPTL